MKPGDNTFQSTPSVWRETYNASEYDLMWGISIHSLRMEGDMSFSRRISRSKHFNPLPPHGGRLTPLCVWTLPTTFQSTPSAWRETAVLQSPLYGFYISIHSLRMEGDPLAQRAEHNPAISIHSLRMEGDNHLPYSFPM